MSRSVWKGYLRLSLVSIPIEIHSATRAEARSCLVERPLRFDLEPREHLGILMKTVARVALFSCLAAPAVAEILPERPTAFLRTSSVFLAPVIAASARIVFASEDRLDLALAPDFASEDHSVMFRVSGETAAVDDEAPVCLRQPHLISPSAQGQGEDLRLQMDTIREGEGGAPFDTSLRCRTLLNVGPEDWSTRLASLDAELEAPAAAPAEGPSGPGGWIVLRQTNPVDDTETVILALEASGGASRWGRSITFQARCMSNRIDVYVIWHDYVGDDSNDVYEEWKWVTVRLGDAPAREERWRVSADKRATFTPEGAGNLLKEMLAVDRMVLQTTPSFLSQLTAVFDTRGLDAVLPELADACDWDD